MKRYRFARALLASAAIAAAIVLAGCDSGGNTPSGRSEAPISEKLLAEIESKQMDKGSPMLVRLFKEEAELEVWKQNREGQYALLKTYPICRWSGDLGPKIKEGDRQAPEGFYTITPGQMNPNSNFYLAFNMGYPNAFDRAYGRTGSELMVHGDCSSRGCYAMTDSQMVEIYALARESFFGGQNAFQVQAYPFRMTPENMVKHRTSKHYAFWKMLKTGNDHFEVTRQQPKVDVCEKRYVFNAVNSSNPAQPLSFNSRGKCPAFTVPSEIAVAVNAKKRKDEQRIASYIARGTPVVPGRGELDGGMNPVFLAQVGTMDGASGKSAPGALPRDDGPPAPYLTLAAVKRVREERQTQVAQTQEPQPQPAQQAQETPATEQTLAPIVVASVPLPRNAPIAKEGEAPKPAQPTTIAGLFGNIFGGGETDTQQQAAQPVIDPAIGPAAAPPPEPPAAKPVRPVLVRTAEAAAPPPPARPQQTAPAPRVLASATPVSEPKPLVLDPVRTTGEKVPVLEPKPAPQPARAAPPPRTAVAMAAPAPEPEPTWPQAQQLPPPPAAVARPAPPPAPARVVRSEPKPKPRTVTPPRAVAKKPPPAEPKPRAVAQHETPPAPGLRTAYAAPPASKAGLLSGAQPVVPVGAFSGAR